MEQIMYDANQNDEDIRTVAEQWVEDNQDKVSE
ncbi:ABC-type proline/glycine betaine transport system substrate-binding protein [Alkalibacillus flavidus]|uniref:ABC-type proline/glycine betaine transport system substrate-binding protein n=1 Tax=Alkalibacillus flavidus TaxID=546021 RepID=A0ABV2KY82_9BACI